VSLPGAVFEVVPQQRGDARELDHQALAFAGGEEKRSLQRGCEHHDVFGRGMDQLLLEIRVIDEKRAQLAHRRPPRFRQVVLRKRPRDVVDVQ